MNKNKFVFSYMKRKSLRLGAFGSVWKPLKKGRDVRFGGISYLLFHISFMPPIGVHSTPGSHSRNSSLNLFNSKFNAKLKANTKRNYYCFHRLSYHSLLRLLNNLLVIQVIVTYWRIIIIWQLVRRFQSQHIFNT